MTPEELNRNKNGDYETLRRLAENLEAFEKYWKLINSPILTEKRTYTDSTGFVINLATPMNYIRQYIEHLPDKEKTKVLSLKKIHNHSHFQSIKYRIDAFGLRKSKEEKTPVQFKLLDDKQEETLELFGRMFSVAEVHNIAIKEWHLPVTLKMLYHFRVFHAKTIEEKVRTHQSKYSDMRLGIKRSRLEELTWLYLNLKEKYKSSQSREDMKVLLQALEQIRKEVEGDSLTINGTLDVNIEASVNTHLKKELFRGLSLNQIILARVAARLNQPAMALVQTLAESYYSRYTGIIQVPQLGSGEEVILPSAIPYDFDKIKAVKAAEATNEKILKEQHKEQITEIIRDESGLSLKERLLRKISDKNRDIKNRNFSVTEETIKAEAKEGIKRAKEDEREALKSKNTWKGNKLTLRMPKK